MFNFFKRLFEPREVSARRREGMKWLRSSGYDFQKRGDGYLCRFCCEKTIAIYHKPKQIVSPISQEVFTPRQTYSHSIAIFCPRCQIVSWSNWIDDDFIKFSDWNGEDLFEKKMAKLKERYSNEQQQQSTN